MQTREIKDRIRSVKNITQITKAMKMVAAARLRRSQERLESARPTADSVSLLLEDLFSRGSAAQHPLAQMGPDEGKDLLVMISSDKGLCGNYNASLSKEAQKIRRERPEGVDVLALGRKGRDFFRKRGVALAQGSESDLTSHPEIAGVTALTRDLTSRFLSGGYRRVDVLFTRFLSMSRREPQVETLLPLGVKKGQAQASGKGGFEALYEPSGTEVLDRLIPLALTSRFWTLLWESQTSEMAARMIAMDNASRNANEMIEGLTLQYNRARQAGITKELAEIVGGAAALEG